MTNSATQLRRRVSSRSGGQGVLAKVLGSVFGAVFASRTRLVLAALAASVTTAGALLFALDRNPATSLQGVALPALMAPGGSPSLEVVFRTREPLSAGRWQAIVIHDSGSPAGTPRSLEAQAKARNLTELGYHFVIGNGNGMDDGELFVARRWRDQLPGAHVAGKYGEWFNTHAIGICLVGDGDRKRPSEAQIDRALEVAAALARRLNIPKDRIYFHSDVAETSSPGKLFPRQGFREELSARL